MVEDMDEEKLKERMLQQWLAQQTAQRQVAEQLKKMEEAAKLERLKQVIIRRVTTEDVRERIGNIKAADPEFAEQIENYILALVQSGKVKIVDFETFKEIVKVLRSGRI